MSVHRRLKSGVTRRPSAASSAAVSSPFLGARGDVAPSVLGADDALRALEAHLDRLRPGRVPVGTRLRSG
jgi:hypothetical protein